MAVTWWIPVVCGIMVLLFEVSSDAGSSYHRVPGGDSAEKDDTVLG
jgi:hypothetical protein